MKSKLIQDKKYSNMYHIEWPEGEVSDMVNKTRARDAIRRYEEYERRDTYNIKEEAPSSPAGAFK